MTTQPNVALRFPAEQRKAIEALAKERGLTFSEQARRLIQQGLEAEARVSGAVDAYLKSFGLNPAQVPDNFRRELSLLFNNVKNVAYVHDFIERHKDDK